MNRLQLVSKSERHPSTVVQVGGCRIGEGITVIAGPCSVEDEEQILRTAHGVRRCGAAVLRGGAFKPRTSPYSFQGLGLKGLQLLRKAGDETGLPVITEVVDTRDVFLVCEYADILQIGARNMQNYALLQEVGRTDRPVFLKRGMNSTIEEWLNCAEYIMKECNSQVILCERGVRTFETYTRNTLDLSAVSVLKNLTHLPVFADPSHATGRPELILPMCLAAIMAGADGIMVEVHVDPARALCDAEQALSIEEFDILMEKINAAADFRRRLGWETLPVFGQR
ncbi:3-deoxy-7-phosphoheptulonate synthase [Victivallis vadensis]|uniref:3-deoxy-7-phosphoheptulonate synthase n=1 Tax=Victivallis vadensis TaxID=172901 RepID=UPI003AF56CDB